MSVESTITAGIEFKLDRMDEGSDDSFTLWISMVSQAIKEHGLDSIILVPNQAWTQETNTIENYGKEKMMNLKS